MSAGEPQVTITAQLHSISYCHYYQETRDVPSFKTTSHGFESALGVHDTRRLLECRNRTSSHMRQVFSRAEKGSL